MAMSLSFGDSSETFFPSMIISPLFKSSSPAIKFISVDFPQPEGPIRIKNSPSLISRFIFFSTSVEPNDLLIPLRLMLPILLSCFYYLF